MNAQLEHVEQSNDTGDTGNYEARAASMGHVPKDKWTGDPAKWVDAKAFVERGEQVLPILQKHNRVLEDRIAKLERENAGILKDSAEFRKMAHNAAERQYANKIADLEAQLAEAIDKGEGAKAVEIQREIRETPAPAPTTTAVQTTQQQTQQTHPDYAAWLAENRWYETNTEAQMEANAIAQQVVASRGLTGRALYDAVNERMRRIRPELFATRGDRGADYENPRGGDGGGRRGERTYSNLPDDAKKACDRYIARGFYLDPEGKPMTVEAARKQYCADYEWD